MSKQQLIESAIEANNELTRMVAGLSDEVILSRTFGDWSIKHVLGHIAGWQRLNTEMMHRIASGQPPIPEGADYSDDDNMNAAFAAEADAQSVVDVVAGHVAAFNLLVAAADALPEERFAEGRMCAKMLQGNGIDHVHEHLAEIRAYLATRQP
ncbi:MAG: maleylpyruvate isomerase N-terminal domain-containing protein [Chloroflexi bacterium]|nr:maleylpyruvate isomerase N-terminal domain-containing protein [Chloroflexota bacterium]